LGTGLLSVISKEGRGGSEPEVSLLLGVYNKSKGVQQDLVRTMSSMMCNNICLSDAHPLIAAVDPGAIDRKTLSVTYDPSHSGKAKLKIATFRNRPRVQIVVLNGRQRVQAARETCRQLSKKVDSAEDVIKEIQRDAEDAYQKPGTTRISELDQLLEAAKEGKKALKDTRKNLEFWPVQFYDKGVHVTWEGKTVPHRPLDTLQSIPTERKDFPGDRHDKDALLRFLSENSPEPLQLKTPNERLAELLFQNLYKPQPLEAWKIASGDNRIVGNICQRPRLWEMVTNLMQVLPSLLGTRLSSASELYTEATNHTMGVSGEWSWYITSVAHSI
jgi:hypothetical protein